VSFVVEKNEPANPIGVAFFGADTVMTCPNRIPELVEKLLGFLVPANRRRSRVIH